VSLYSIFIIIEMYLMVRAIKQGPDEPHGAGDHGKEKSPAKPKLGGSVLGGDYAPVHAKTLMNEQSSKEV
jgi:cytochrome d ubiquinol oxidase subunit I